MVPKSASVGIDAPPCPAPQRCHVIGPCFSQFASSLVLFRSQGLEITLACHGVLACRNFLKGSKTMVPCVPWALAITALLGCFLLLLIAKP
ncbi:unnamed protein product [Citrullus colocynthis]|uniref:Uncharacterized protein n=1 Tax=Citrullus colocynthis TaxID=252529 RepID=A0ABP0YAG6_9ROSI